MIDRDTGLVNPVSRPAAVTMMRRRTEEPGERYHLRPQNQKSFAFQYARHFPAVKSAASEQKTDVRMVVADQQSYGLSPSHSR
jgi:hypothetical protein